jgi:hypothetical protein
MGVKDLLSKCKWLVIKNLFDLCELLDELWIRRGSCLELWWDMCREGCRCRKCPYGLIQLLDIIPGESL